MLKFVYEACQVSIECPWLAKTSIYNPQHITSNYALTRHFSCVLDSSSVHRSAPSEKTSNGKVYCVVLTIITLVLSLMLESENTSAP